MTHTLHEDADRKHAHLHLTSTCNINKLVLNPFNEEFKCTNKSSTSILLVSSVYFFISVTEQRFRN